MESLPCLLVEIFLPLELTLVGQQRIMSQGRETDILLVDREGYSERCHSHFHPSIPRCENPGCGRNSTDWTQTQSM